MLFGGLFVGYTVYRAAYPEAFILGSAQLDVMLGGVNTAVLICSSLTMALAVRSAFPVSTSSCVSLSPNSPRGRVCAISKFVSAPYTHGSTIWAFAATSPATRWRTPT